ncbi:hypothetical protein EDB81DRAFT_722915 [Dactylonectria macrodidyma]|uniref:Uncharacterized protein n=1 Tax=Dactylonectria macrodidyma TaxID=307937 RepID=A0A9P9ER02_9HYPO|nr:hypothetical protein EDB81DRAFT_722915 [Dactylonectria macrodidyma]
MSHCAQSHPHDPTVRQPVAYTRVDATKSNDAHQPCSPAEEVETAQWRVGWQTPAKMLGFLVLGIISALSHHLYYLSLSSTPVRTREDGAQAWATQVWISRYGLALAFTTKTFLACAVAIAYKQRIWTNFRQRPYSVSGINAIYDATTDILSFTNWEFVWRAKMATFLAALTWTIPLSALVTPSSLLVTLKSQEFQRPMAVPMLEFDNSSSYRFEGMAGNVSPLLMRVTSATASSGEILPMALQALNTSYTLQFDGPSLKCDNATGFMLKFIDIIHAEAVHVVGGSSGGQAIYLSITADSSYLELTSTETNYLNLSAWDFSKMNEECLQGRGACPYQPQPEGHPGSFPLLVRLHDQSLVCSLQNTTYDITLSSSDTTQILAVAHPYDFKWRGPANVANSNSSYVAAAQALANLLNGAISQQRSGAGSHTHGILTTNIKTTGTSIMQTSLIGTINASTDGVWGQVLPPLPEEDQALARSLPIGRLIEELSRNQTLSLFSSPRFWTDNGKWAIKNTTQTLSINIWEYHMRNLWLSNGLAILGASFGVLVGLFAIHQNGISHNTSFCGIMAMTRNGTLDELTKRSSLGGNTVAKELRETKLLFGVLNANKSMAVAPRAAFGVPTEISQLQKGQAVM